MNGPYEYIGPTPDGQITSLGFFFKYRDGVRGFYLDDTGSNVYVLENGKYKAVWHCLDKDKFLKLFHMNNYKPYKLRLP